MLMDGWYPKYLILLDFGSGLGTMIRINFDNFQILKLTLRYQVFKIKYGLFGPTTM